MAAHLTRRWRIKLMRWIKIGKPTSGSPHQRNDSWTKLGIENYSSDRRPSADVAETCSLWLIAFLTLSMAQECGQRGVQRLAGAQQHVVDAVLRTPQPHF